MRASFGRAAASYDEAAVLARETGRRMAARLDFVRIEPHRIADIGCATGDGIRLLAQRYPKALPLAIDHAGPMLDAVRHRTPWQRRLVGRAPRLINADVRALPLADASLGLAWSNLMLHWLDDLRPAFAELHRVLEVGGLLMFAMLGPDTLKELRAAAIEANVDDPASVGRRFLDMHDVGDLLLQAGFAAPVMDMEMITLTYAGPRGLLADQRHLGVRDGIFGQRGWRDWRNIFAAWPRQADDRLPASFEIIHGHAWKATITTPSPRTTPDGRTIVHLTRR